MNTLFEFISKKVHFKIGDMYFESIMQYISYNKAILLDRSATAKRIVSYTYDHSEIYNFFNELKIKTADGEKFVAILLEAILTISLNPNNEDFLSFLYTGKFAFPDPNIEKAFYLAKKRLESEEDFSSLVVTDKLFSIKNSIKDSLFYSTRNDTSYIVVESKSESEFYFLTYDIGSPFILRDIVKGSDIKSIFRDGNQVAYVDSNLKKVKRKFLDGALPLLSALTYISTQKNDDF